MAGLSLVAVVLCLVALAFTGRLSRTTHLSSARNAQPQASDPAFSNNTRQNSNQLPEKVINQNTPASASASIPASSIARSARHPENNPQSAEDSEGERAKAPGSVEEEREGRGDWFYEQRAYPLDEIPRGARLRALEQLGREERRHRLEASVQADADLAGEQVWAAIGPAPISNGFSFGFPQGSVSGRVTAIALDPGYNGTSNQTVYVGGAQGGVWRSTDNGVNWAPILDNEASLAVGSLAVDPTNPNVIYVGTGEPNRAGDTYYGAGLLKSADGGATWTRITGPTSTRDPQQPAFINAAIGQIAIDPVTPSTLFLATTFGSTASATGSAGRPALGQVGIWKSSDGGATWKNVDPDGSSGAQSGHDILIDPQNHQVVYAAVRSRGIYRSVSGGEPGTWTVLKGGLPEVTNTQDPPFFRPVIAAGPPIAPSTSATLYAAFASKDDTLLGIWRSTDGGNVWTQLATPSTSGQENYNIALAVDPADANVVYYGTSANSNYNGGTLVRSRDGGQTWTDISRGNGTTSGLHPDTHAVVVSRANRNILFTGNDGGIWRTDGATNDFVSWTTLNQNLSFSQFQSVALHPTDLALLLGGTQDNGTLLYNGGISWSLSDGGDGGFALIDQSNPQVMYHTRFNQNNSGGETAQIGPRFSSNGGQTWSSSRGCFGCTAQQGRFNPADRVSFYPPMAQHIGFTGGGGNVIYFGTHRLYRTADQGLTWTGLGASADSFGADLTKGSGSLSAIAAHPSLNNSTTPPGEIVWTGSSDGLIEVTTNAGALAGATFTNVTKAPLPNRFITDIGLDSNNTQRAVVVYSGFNTSTPTAPGHVFQTTNQGTSWADISGNLPDVPVTSVALDPNNTSHIWIGTDIGVFETTDSGANWARLGNGMPKVAVFMVRYHTASGTLVAATHGRGIYRLTTARASTTVSAANYSALAIAGESIVAAFGTGLATGTTVATTIPLPTVLGGTRVVVRDGAGVERLAPLFFVSPNQVNYQIPAGTAAGTATVTITSSDGIVSAGAAQVATSAPSLFTADASGQGIAAAFAVRVRNGSQTVEQVYRFDSAQGKNVGVPLDLGPAGDTVVLVLYGTGLRNRTSQNAVTASIGGANSEVLYASVAPGFIGLDQLNVVVPRSLAGRNSEVDVVVTVDGKTANTVRVSIK